MKKNYYEILGVEQNATTEQIKQAYDSKLLRNETIRKAYETLIDEELRKEYDKDPAKASKLKYYEILGVEQNATTEQIKQAYYNLPFQDRSDIDLELAYYTLKDAKKRTEYNFDLGKFELKKEQSKSFIEASEEKLGEKHDNYFREIYIEKYQSKIQFLEKQIEFLQDIKDTSTISYRIELSNLIAQLEKAHEELNKWKLGRKEEFEKATVKTNGATIDISIKRKGHNRSLISNILSKSIENLEEIETNLEKKDVSNISKIGLSLKAGFWKKIKDISAGTIKIHTATWSKIQDIVVRKPNFITSLKESENDLEERLERVRTVR